MNKIVVLASTPPPLGGQAIMIKHLLDGSYEHIDLVHVNMAFSREMSSIGKFNLRKVFHLFEIVGKAISSRFVHQTNVLYYAPGGANSLPIIRDIISLSVLRLFYSKVIFHFHAGGVSELLQSQPLIIKKLAEYVYRKPDIAIHLTEVSPNDGGYFKAKHIKVINNGLVDEAAAYMPIDRTQRTEVNLLFVGVLRRSKGVMTLLEAFHQVVSDHQHVRLTVMGAFESPEFREEVMRYCETKNLTDRVTFPGVVKGEEKWKHFVAADIFCFPTYFESESMSLVVLEAMMFGLPVVSTQWRGIPFMINHGANGFLSPIQDPEKIAEYLHILITDPEKRVRMGFYGRKSFVEHFQIGVFQRNMEETFLELRA